MHLKISIDDAYLIDRLHNQMEQDLPVEVLIIASTFQCDHEDSVVRVIKLRQSFFPFYFYMLIFQYSHAIFKLKQVLPLI